VNHPQHGRLRMPGFPVDSAACNAQGHRPAPACGEHTREVLYAAGFEEDEIQVLQQARAAHCTAA
jgi:crotonobetainyl-CoA:carnitine CoA-transferase CaiB-like acyl-CoA transferase